MIAIKAAMFFTSAMRQAIKLCWKPVCMRRVRLATVWLFAFICIGAVGGPSDSASPAVAPASRNTTEKSPWQRIVLIGASVTAGFTPSEPLGGSNTADLDLGRYVDAALLAPHEPVQNLGNTFFFLQPQLFARQQVTRALTNNPTLVIGVDFLFWFCYGEGSTDKERLQRFDQGLKLLEKVECPLVLGDIPDASAAVNGMLQPEQMPSLTAISAANRRLKEWATGRRHVVILGVSEFMRNVTANRMVKIHDYVLPAGKTRALLQDDYLHSSPSGCAVMAWAALDALQSTRPGSRAGEFRRDPNEVLRRVFASPKPTPTGVSKPKVPSHE